MAKDRSHYVLLAIASLIAIGPFAMETYLPAIPTIAGDLNTSIVQINLSVSSYLFGMGLGQFFGGPISDQTGRRKNKEITETSIDTGFRIIARESA